MGHTPGPWTITTHGNQYGIIWGAERGVAVIRDLKGETEANANLIAAAPELLEVLENLVRCLQHHSGITGLTLDAVIERARRLRQKAKAKGE